MKGEIFQVEQSEETFRGLLESAPDAMVIVDATGNMVLINAQTERLFGYTREELLGRAVEILVPQRFREGHPRHRAGYVVEPHVRPMGINLDLFGRRKDGSEFPVEISLSPISTPSGTLIASAIRDITERRRFEKELQEKNVALENANLAKDRFLAGMSHELRTPLNAVIGFTGTLLMKLPGPLTDEQEQQLRIIQSSARHLLSLINDVLDLAKIQSGKIEVHFEPVNVRHVVEDVAAALRGMAQEKGLTFEVALPDNSLTVMTDQRALHQVLLNLTNNAIKYTEKGLVRIEMRERDVDGQRYVDFSIIDSGIGIKAEDQPRLFEAFEQIDSSSTRRFQGAGLGLYLSSQLATLLGGRLHFVSEFGRGSTFTLSLPRD